jgi:3-hydroxybutyryl-CoA dehydrogenase
MTVHNDTVIVDENYDFTGNAVQLLSIATANPAKLIIVNSVCDTLDGLPGNVVRYNGWHTFAERQLVEASCSDPRVKEQATEYFLSINKTIEWIPDIPGFLSARVITMIINEAYYTLQDNISTREEIDIAMKLGTNYPYGPFEWSQLIGLKNIYRLLKKLEETNPRYSPAQLLVQESSL